MRFAFSFSRIFRIFPCIFVDWGSLSLGSSGLTAAPCPFLPLRPGRVRDGEHDGHRAALRAHRRHRRPCGAPAQRPSLRSNPFGGDRQGEC